MVYSPLTQLRDAAQLDRQNDRFLTTRFNFFVLLSKLQRDGLTAYFVAKSVDKLLTSCSETSKNWNFPAVLTKFESVSSLCQARQNKARLNCCTSHEPNLV